jgi:transglutaminase-like putative cysteine protease
MTDHVRAKAVSTRAIGRREVLRAALAAPVLAAARPDARGREEQNPTSWRTFEVRVRVDLVGADGPSRLWVPLALARPTPYQRTLSQTWTGNTTAVQLFGDPASGAPMLIADWTSGTPEPSLTLTLEVATRGHQVPLTATRPPAAERMDRYLQPTRLIPTTGIVRRTAQAIVRGHATPLARARAIYDWVVDNTFRNPAVEGCGLGDIRWMLETGSLGGKCADLNALFVGLCRSIGLPARDLYGLRVAASERFKSLGRSGDVTTAQHCRAEVYVERLGWIPADPADVRKVVLEEEPDGSIESESAKRARALLFGSWEMNWVAFNDAHDVRLPGSRGDLLPFFMYPEVEISGTRRNSLDAPSFRYSIAAAEMDRR